jgi:hypothetical protein
MAGGGKVMIWLKAGLPVGLLVTSIEPKAVVPRIAGLTLEPIPVVTVDVVGSVLMLLKVLMLPMLLMPDNSMVGGGTRIRGLMPGLPLSTAVRGSAPFTKSAAAFGSGGVVVSTGVPGVIGLQTADSDIVPKAGVEPAGTAGMIPLAASIAAIVGVLVGNVAMPAAGQAETAPSGPICEGAARLPRLRKMPPAVSVAVPGRGAAVDTPG